MTDRRPFVESVCLFVGALALRCGLLAACARRTGLAWRDLALMYDGHVYILVAHSLPHLYQGIHVFFPAFRNSEYFTGWFPGYPAVIALLDLALRDWRLSALLASQLAAGGAVVVFYALARRLTRRPLLAAALFAVFPSTWLLAGSLAFVEPLYILCALLALYFFYEERWAASALFVALAMLCQKSGALLLAVFVAALWLRERARAPKLAAWYAAALLPMAALQLYLWKAFGDPFINVRVQREIFTASSSSVFVLPFSALVQGLLAPARLLPAHAVLRKALIAGSALFYVGACLLSWRRPTKQTLPLALWLTACVIFHACLGGLWGYYGWPRFMTLAAPVALLVLADRLPPWRPSVLTAGAAAVALLCAATALMDAGDAVPLIRRMWPPGYFESLSSRL